MDRVGRHRQIDDTEGIGFVGGENTSEREKEREGRGEEEEKER